jgi:hypothetical protein
MNKMQRNTALFAVIVTAVLLAGCITPGNVAGPPASESPAQPASNSGMRIAGEKTTLVDWTGRTSGRAPNPDWLGDAEEGLYAKFQETYGVTDGVCRIAIGSGADLRAAQMRVSMNFARQVAKDLATKVSTKAAELARSGGMNDATAQAIEERTTTQSTADISGSQMRTEYFKKLETEDSRTGKVTTQYVVYQVHVFRQDVWDQLQMSYLRKVIGDLPANLKPEQREIATLLDRMDYDERHPVVLDQQQREQRLEAEKRMVDAQIALMPAQQEAAAKAELAKLNQEALSERSRINADARVAMEKAIAEGRTQEAAYLSGDPILQAAATVTAADGDVINSRWLAMAADILL